MNAPFSSTQPTPLSLNVPTPNASTTQPATTGNPDAAADRPVKKRRKLVPKLNAQEFTKASTISSLVNIGRATADEYTKLSKREKKVEHLEARMLETVLRRGARWATTVAPQHSLAQFVVEARVLSGKRKVRSYISNVRLAQLRGADIGAEEENEDEEYDEAVGQGGNNEYADNRNNGADGEKELGGNGGGGYGDMGIGADVPDYMDDIPDMNDVVETQDMGAQKQLQQQQQPQEQGDGWEEPEDLFMDEAAMESMPMSMPMSSTLTPTPTPKQIPATSQPATSAPAPPSAPVTASPPDPNRTAATSSVPAETKAAGKSDENVNADAGAGAKGSKDAGNS